MKISRFEIIILTIATVISLLAFFLPLAPACATIAPPCRPTYFQDRLPFLAWSILTFIIFAVALFIVSFNRVRKEIGEFGGWRKVILKTIISWVAAAVFTAALIWIFWNKKAAIYSLFIGPPLAITVSAYFLAKNKPVLSAVLSVTALIATLVFIYILLFIILVLSPSPSTYYPTIF